MRRQGFTLIEVVVVLGVITILFSTVVPALNLAKKQANAVVCNSNIRQLLFTMTLYTGNNSNTFPIGFKSEMLLLPPEGRAGAHGQDKMGWWWFNYIGPLYNESDRDKNILLCPSKKTRNPTLRNNILCNNYGVNQSICRIFSEKRDTEFIGLPLKFTEIQQPEQTLLIIDSGYALINWWHASDQPPEPLTNKKIEDASYVPGLKINSEKELWPGQENDAICGRHINKKVNIGFADGHLEFKKADEVLVEKQNHEYKNLYPLWSPRR